MLTLYKNIADVKRTPLLNSEPFVENWHRPNIQNVLIKVLMKIIQEALNAFITHTI